MLLLPMYAAAKQMVARRAVELVSSGMCVGLGTGSTASLFIAELGLAIRDGRLTDVTGVPTSVASEQLAQEHGVRLFDTSNGFICDLTIDGADEIDPQLELIKGLGGALLREKIVAQNSRRVVIISDATKRVSRLGTKSLLPVEVIPFARSTSERFLRELNLKPRLRTKSGGETYLTDNGNAIFDCAIEHIDDMRALARDLSARAGIVGHGLFIGIADLAVVADEAGQIAMLTRVACG